MIKTSSKSLFTRILSTICVLALIVSTAVFSGCSENSEPDSSSQSAVESSSEENLLSGKKTAVIDIKDYGKITLELDADTAPITVTNFVNLANQGFYDGLTFHRIINGFMMQGGDPNGDGTGGSDKEIKGEFSANGVANDISHTRGVISMARSTLYNSASSQFFIVHEDSTHLDDQYAAFGHVTDGMDIVDKICEETPVTDGNGTVLPENQPVINTIEIVD